MVELFKASQRSEESCCAAWLGISNGDWLTLMQCQLSLSGTNDPALVKEVKKKYFSYTLDPAACLRVVICMAIASGIPVDRK